MTERRTWPLWGGVGVVILAAHILAALIAGAWWWSAWVPARSPQAPQALDGLKNLRAATQAGLPFDHYRTRLLDAQVTVNRYLETPPAAHEEPFRAALRKASALYGAASDVWVVKIRAAANAREYATASSHPALTDCPALAAHVAQAEQRGSDTLTREELRGIGVTTGIPLLWGCAEAQLALADQAWPARP